MSLNSIRENKILAKISNFTAFHCLLLLPWSCVLGPGFMIYRGLT